MRELLPLEVPRSGRPRARCDAWVLTCQGLDPWVGPWQELWGSTALGGQPRFHHSTCLLRVLVVPRDCTHVCHTHIWGKEDFSFLLELRLKTLGKQTLEPSGSNSGPSFFTS